MVEALHDLNLICKAYWTENSVSDECDLAKAKEYGFVNHLYDNQSELVKGAFKLANQIAKNSPAAVFGCKKVINYSQWRKAFFI